MSAVLLESRPYRPFKSQDEYLVAMREDLAEWLQEMYPVLNITAETFMDRLETGVALCEHANACKALAHEYVQKKHAKQIMMKSITGSIATAQTLIKIADVNYIAVAKPGTFFARDNLSNFIHWCRHSLKIIECLLFESDDLILRKNEKHVILCLLEVARKGAKFGVPAPMLVQMERQIDREIAADQRRLGFGQNASCQTQTAATGGDEDSDSETEGEDTQPPMIYGPLPQIVTNDLKSLDEMVRDLVEICTCPTQFKMIRLSEGKYRIGDTNTLIFVRILRNHVMVRVGGGWDTLSHYLEKHDPCRCRSQHKATLGARLVNKPGAHDLAGAHVYYDRSTVSPYSTNTSSGNIATDSAHNKGGGHLGPPMNSLNRSRSRSPTAAAAAMMGVGGARRSVSPNLPRRSTTGLTGFGGGGMLGVGPRQRSRSPTPYYTSTHTTKLTPPTSAQVQTPTSPRKGAISAQYNNSGPQSLPILSGFVSSGGIARKKSSTNASTHVSTIQITPEQKQPKPSTTEVTNNTTNTIGDATTDQQSDNGSEVSDEGYRSLGILDKNHKYRSSVHSPNSSDDAEYNEQHDSIIDTPPADDDSTNDCGLRRTNYSLQIYGDQHDSATVKPKPPSREHSVETAAAKAIGTIQPDQQPTKIIAPLDQGHQTARITSPLDQGQQETSKSTSALDQGQPQTATISPSLDQGQQTARTVYTKAGSRGNSPRKVLGSGGGGIKPQHGGTWSGRGIGGGSGERRRVGLGVDTFVAAGPQSLTTDFTPTQTNNSNNNNNNTHFKRNSTTRMTTGSASTSPQHLRRNSSSSSNTSQSAHTSPIKTGHTSHWSSSQPSSLPCNITHSSSSQNNSGNLKHDLLRTLNTCPDDEDQLVECLHRLIKQHSSASLYPSGGDVGEVSGAAGVKTRRDSRPDVTVVSRIPAPRRVS